MLYIAAAVAVSARGVYGTCVGNALKWFPTAAGCGRLTARASVPAPR